MKRPTKDSESRLEALRREADATGRVTANGVRAEGSPLPVASPGYYDLPLLKPPVWTWEVPAYFFVGGAAGASAVVALMAQIAGKDRELVRDARWIAAIGATLSGPLLIADLGRPTRFLNMLRIFKPQSPMSVGAWTLAIFGGATAAAAAVPWRGVANTAAVAAAGTGAVMATYTGVLLGVSAIPLWSSHAKLLPVHFGASALGSAVALLELRGHRQSALHALAIGAAVFETAAGVAIESGADPVDLPLREGSSSALIRLGGVLSGPVPLALRLLGGRSSRTRRLAGLSTLVGSLLTRYAWVEAGKASART